MKKFLPLLLVFTLIFSFSACKKNSEENINTNCLHEEKILAFLPLEFKYTIPSEELYTSIRIEADGCFTGTFYDSVPDEKGEDYPGGTVYHAKFSGKFEKIEKLDDTVYKLYLASVSYETKGEEINDGVKFVSANPEGLSQNAEYLLYTPEAPTADLHEVFLFNWPYLAEQPEKLSCYGLMNTKNNNGFFVHS